MEGTKDPVSAPPAPPLLLASTSPQRRRILEQLGLPFDVVAPRYEEHDPHDADPVELVRTHASGKARSVADEAEGRPVLGVDTTGDGAGGLVLLVLLLRVPSLRAVPWQPWWLAVAVVLVGVVTRNRPFMIVGWIVVVVVAVERFLLDRARRRGDTPERSSLDT